MGLLKVGRLIEVTITACVWAKIRDFENWPLNRGWPLNTGPLYTGSTVYSDDRGIGNGFKTEYTEHLCPVKNLHIPLSKK